MTVWLKFCQFKLLYRHVPLNFLLFYRTHEIITIVLQYLLGIFRKNKVTNFHRHFGSRLKQVGAMGGASSSASLESASIDAAQVFDACTVYPYAPKDRESRKERRKAKEAERRQRDQTETRKTKEAERRQRDQAERREITPNID